ncbi:MAG: DNA repair protein RadA [Albidovulum sp.]|nr:DNA repair protein RadA [Albidovulum sp.]
MAKRNAFQCSACGAPHMKWTGCCNECGEWNTVHELVEASLGPSQVANGAGRGRPLELVGLAHVAEPPERRFLGIAELDRVLGGGIVSASAVLIGGDPGIGKSTLLLQAAANFAANGGSAVYISGEEATTQVQMRAERIGLSSSPVMLVSETGIRDIVATLEATRPDIAIVDSVQTMWVDSVDSAPGSVSQLRAVVYQFVRFAKRSGSAVFLIGHVTKDGQIAGPRVVEHLVDTVLYFEGERGHQYRMLRAVKNRFGPADEIGVFEMTGKGLQGVENPSAMFLSDRGRPSPGSAVFAGIEGTRPLLVEFQALVAQSAFASPRRNVVGWDGNRLAMVLAVLDARCGIGFGGQDLYLNIAGGIRITEPAADLAVAAAIISASAQRPLSSDTVVFGEISLTGALRPVAKPELRLKEAKKLGFSRALAPVAAKKVVLDGIEATWLSDLPEFVHSLYQADEN